MSLKALHARQPLYGLLQRESKASSPVPVLCLPVSILLTLATRNHPFATVHVRQLVAAFGKRIRKDLSSARTRVRCRLQRAGARVFYGQRLLSLRLAWL